jgi:crotonobetainyl-CoA:carnitine CoA-transferase CaiB-like acyl-CoA transferase
MDAVLDGIKVLDLTRVLAGPWATMTLGDLGAEIWKIEQPGAGDDTRGWVPPSVGDHTDAVLAEHLQLDPEQIARLRAAGAIG